MGDLRNKMAKQLRDAQHRTYMAMRNPSKPPHSLPKCLCGLTWNEAPVMWAIAGADRWSPAAFYCPACLPAHLIGLVAAEVANPPEGT
jgi:hypothetical protein